jgi:photosystem II stability/assembly factor-like uncharacterized protein
MRLCCLIAFGSLLAVGWMTTAARGQTPAVGPAPRGDFGNQSPSLRTLPMVRVPALPLGRNDQPVADALDPPPYCDSSTLAESASLRAIDVWDSRFGLAVGDHGSIVRSRDGGRSWESVVSGVRCSLRDVIWLNAKQAVAVGGGFEPVTRISRGVVLVSRDAGRTWNQVTGQDLPLLLSLRVTLDESGGRPTITAFGRSDPVSGAERFESNDGGRNWQAVTDSQDRTMLDDDASARQPKSALSWQQSLQITEVVGGRALQRCLDRIDDTRWVCGGDHGTIFRSEDGGRTWRAVRGDRTGSGVLVIAAKPRHLPWSLIGRESLEQRLRSQVLLLDCDPRDLAVLQQAAVQMAAAALDVPDAAAPAEPLLKRCLSVVRPPILALDADLDEGLKSALLHHAVAGGTEKVVEYSRHRRGESLLHDNAMLPGTGTFAGDLRDDCRLLLGWLEPATANADGSPASNGIALTTPFTSGSQTKYGDTLAVGISIGSQRRLPPRDNPATRRRLQVLQGRLKQQRSIDQLLRNTAASRSKAMDEKQFGETLTLLLDRTSRDDRFRTAFKMLQQTRHHPLRHLVCREIAQRFGDSSAGRLAEWHGRARETSWEWNHVGATANDSAETWNRAAASEQPPNDPPLDEDDDRAELLPQAAAQGTVVSPFQIEPAITDTAPGGVVQASASMPVEDVSVASPTVANGRPTSGSVDLAWQMHPVRLLMENAQKRGERKPDAEPSAADTTWSADLQRVAGQPTAWSTLLRERSPQVTVAARADQPPLLDGFLNEGFWSTPAITRTQHPVRIRAAWDDRFVYLAVQVPRRSIETNPNTDDIGRRDADLTDDDRIVLGLDLDRDLLTALNLAFTPDGRTHDDLDGDPSWDPSWYIASKASADTLTSEIAIERSGLNIDLRRVPSWLVAAEVVPKQAARPQPFMPSARTRVRIDFDFKPTR